MSTHIEAIRIAERCSDTLSCLERALFVVLSFLQDMQLQLLCWLQPPWAATHAEISFSGTAIVESFLLLWVTPITEFIHQTDAFSLWSVTGSPSDVSWSFFFFFHISPEKTTAIEGSFHQCQVTAVVNVSDVCLTLEVPYNLLRKKTLEVDTVF